MNMSITKKVRKRVYVSRLYPPFSPHLDLKLDARPAEAASSRGSRSKVIENLDFNAPAPAVYECCFYLCACGAPTFQRLLLSRTRHCHIFVMMVRKPQKGLNAFARIRTQNGKQES